ncbi:flagellar basal body P-ring formation chaperone FlgA [Helicobacter cappadocius]|uniref:Flagella basal body P-ring formation protein FlgA n=1 Tax=Helicobacter cappadocius TaxID=3063998 RepID=A0AA90PKG2_9HELI|nr:MULTISPECIES: flagellar basal body P-ring formation chaperone FlgA [unclassified Helicobacter]MDO7253653.1 flagellar basal body P-ring formation chaperone FlgA [Helicobacter sp. faydin-H75]MDP2539581.1 flagellar basal body P-ring formation chaperone FlgA [Helicobacter sp. faydin-H76]
MKSIFLLFILAIHLWAVDNLAQIKNYIQKTYEKKYQTYGIHISSISISIPSNMLIQNYKIQSMSLDSKNLNKKEGIILLDANLNNSLLKIPLQYQLQATINVYRAIDAIKTSENITDKNVKKDIIGLDRILQMPIDSSQINHTSAKSYINANSIITFDKIQSKILIRKNDSFVGFIKDKQITLQTTLIAKENGSLGDIINAINPETKKIIKVKVIDTDKGEIL